PLSWIVSARSNRRYCSPPTGTSTKVRSSIFFLTSKRLSAEFLHSRRSCWHHILELKRRQEIYLDQLRSTTSPSRNWARLDSSSCHPITRCTSCSPRAQLGSRSAWCRGRPASW